MERVDHGFVETLGESLVMSLLAGTAAGLGLMLLVFLIAAF